MIKRGRNILFGFLIGIALALLLFGIIPQETYNLLGPGDSGPRCPAGSVPDPDDAGECIDGQINACQGEQCGINYNEPIGDCEEFWGDGYVTQGDCLQSYNNGYPECENLPPPCGVICIDNCRDQVLNLYMTCVCFSEWQDQVCEGENELTVNNCVENFEDDPSHFLPPIPTPLPPSPYSGTSGPRG